MSRVTQYKNNVIDFVQTHHWHIVFFVALFLLAQGSFAEDALSAAEPIVKDTYNGSMKTYLYVGEGVAAVMAVIFSRSIKHLGAVLGISVFLNIVAALAGI